MEGYVNSAAAIPGSSPSGPSSSEFEVSLDHVGEDENEARRSKPEEVTVSLVNSFLQYALHLCLLQDPAASTETRVRVARNRNTIRIADAAEITAEDDGGICRMVDGDIFTHTWPLSKPRGHSRNSLFMRAPTMLYLLSQTRF